MGFQQTLARHLRKPTGFAGKLAAVLMNRVNDKMNRFTLEQLELQPSDTVMEIGFGSGKYFPDVLQGAADGRLVGLDYAETMVNQASRKYQSFIQQGRLTLIHGDVSKIPCEANTFDKVFTVNTIYFWPDPIPDMREIHRVVKENGRFVLAFRSRESMEKQGFTKHGFELYTPEEIMEMASTAGFKQVKLEEAPEQVRDVYCVIAVK